jgi:hypothetical protein
MAHNLLPIMDGVDSPSLKKPTGCLLNLFVTGKSAAWMKSFWQCSLKQASCLVTHYLPQCHQNWEMMQ